MYRRVIRIKMKVSNKPIGTIPRVRVRLTPKRRCKILRARLLTKNKVRKIPRIKFRSKRLISNRMIIMTRSTLVQKIKARLTSKMKTLTET